MPPLQPAGILGRLFSAVFPRQLRVQIRSEELADGRVSLTPVYLIAGQEVDPALVGLACKQRILGYSVVADKSVLNARRRGATTLTKHTAAEHSAQRPTAAMGEIGADALEVKARVTLTLNRGDTLDVHADLATPEGLVVAKPADLDHLRRDQGWCVAEAGLLHVWTTDTEWDELLIAGETTHRLTGVSVPEFLQALDTFADKLGRIEKNDALRDLAVYGDQHENRAAVDGDDESIRVSPQLVYYGRQRREFGLTAADLSPLRGGQGAYKRIAEGWIDVDPLHVEEYRRASKELRAHLGGLERIQGVHVPDALVKLQRPKPGTVPWAVHLSDAVQNAHRIVDAPAEVEFHIDVLESDGRSLLEIVPVYNHGEFQFSHAEIREAVAQGQAWIRRPATWIRVDTETCQRIEAAIKLLGLKPGGSGYAFPASLRERVIEVFSRLGSIAHAPSYDSFLAQLTDFDKIENVDLPTSLRPGIAFRPYQRHGFNWLAFLHRFGLNGILADDMGLGKTLQTLAILQKAKEQGQGKSPSLIICPTSVVNNWQAEAEKFFAGCTVILYTGSHREAQRRRIQRLVKPSSNGSAAPLVVTSYDIARRDHAQLNRIPWLYVVVDEGHNIKNPRAKRTKAIKAIQGQHKLVLTGTPIQNKLEELWSLFDFAMPGFLGTRRAFRNKYGRCDQIDWDAVRQGPGNLKDRIRPFVMRRLKEHVARDLPPKIVVDQRVELSALQVELYRQVLGGDDFRRVFQEIDAVGVRRAKVFILKLFTTLRAICNHPALAKEYYRAEGVHYEDSGKLECLKELMEEIVDGEHRALLFCQSTQMLDIIEGFFRQWKFTSLRLDGDTPPPLRPELVREFNGNSAIQCFLISTKAGGTGLNLTGADTVIFYDHDWNPANDSQAQDRAYRIGQTKPVTVYRLITQGTIEEKILERQELKQTLADEIIGADEEGFKELGREELLGLFKLGG